MELKTQQFDGKTMYLCPTCPMDNENLAYMRKHAVDCAIYHASFEKPTVNETPQVAAEGEPPTPDASATAQPKAQEKK